MLACICLIVGAGFLLYYPVSDFLFQREQKEELRSFREELRRVKEEQKQEASSFQEGSDGQPADQEEARIFPELYDEIVSYNTSIFESRQADLKDAWSYEQPVFHLEHYGLPTDMFGIITIPAMKLELPLYLGASRENLARGAAILGQTSIPIGQENTNCVIAGHRGYRGKLFFCEIDALKVGDQVKIEHLWGEQLWEVFEIAIISPEDVEAIRIREGEELLTLITCHPYALNYNRYVVYCRPAAETQEAERPNKSETEPETTSAKDDEVRQEETTEQREQRMTGEDWGKVRRGMEKVLFVAGIAMIVWALFLLFHQKRR